MYVHASTNTLRGRQTLLNMSVTVCMCYSSVKNKLLIKRCLRKSELHILHSELARISFNHISVYILHRTSHRVSVCGDTTLLACERYALSLAAGNQRYQLLYAVQGVESARYTGTVHITWRSAVRCVCAEK